MIYPKIRGLQDYESLLGKVYLTQAYNPDQDMKSPPPPSKRMFL